MASNLSPKIPKYICDNCEYITNNKKDFIKHLSTAKHFNASKCYENASKNPQKSPDVNYVCGTCNKKYIHDSSFYRHKKKCLKNMNEEKLENLNNEITPQLILSVMQQNKELQQMILEQNKTIIEISKSSTINNTINNNSNNKTFNLQFFLNETCKDAMNIMDFVDSIKIQLTDIESIGELGYVNGISKLIIKNLKALDEHMRPVHCSDLKRESLYVKDANVWEKEDSDNKKIKKAIKYIAHKNICALPIWKAKYPDYNNSESKRSDQYSSITMEAMGGQGDNDEEKANKIVKKIAKEVLITKNN
jgi:hypothetical protein